MFYGKQNEWDILKFYLLYGIKMQLWQNTDDPRPPDKGA